VAGPSQAPLTTARLRRRFGIRHTVASLRHLSAFSDCRFVVCLPSRERPAKPVFQRFLVHRDRSFSRPSGVAQITGGGLISRSCSTWSSCFRSADSTESEVNSRSMCSLSMDEDTSRGVPCGALSNLATNASAGFNRLACRGTKAGVDKKDVCGGGEFGRSESRRVRFPQRSNGQRIGVSADAGIDRSKSEGVGNAVGDDGRTCRLRSGSTMRLVAGAYFGTDGAAGLDGGLGFEHSGRRRAELQALLQVEEVDRFIAPDLRIAQHFDGVP